MHITYEDAKARLAKIIEAKGEDYVYTRDPKSIEAARARSEELRLESVNPDAEFWKNQDGVQIDDDGKEFASQCTYRNVDGTPGCLVGHFFYDINPELRLDESGWSQRLIEGTGITIDDEASNLLAEVQDYQDSGSTWGNALRAAVNGVEGDL